MTQEQRPRTWVDYLLSKDPTAGLVNPQADGVFLTYMHSPEWRNRWMHVPAGNCLLFSEFGKQYPGGTVYVLNFADLVLLGLESIDDED